MVIKNNSSAKITENTRWKPAVKKHKNRIFYYFYPGKTRF
ncbi:hypothetical protein L21SP5_01570 [Salinivirga cyanobacteriivorans]|uniref:Uncharacterized protein n=1 Tax=Salinivirga cyanobacteriivorans TaxID=1307839 RepID=A0A0S2HYT8_9BACT|nr:hypothetical protein L21SP5_01570 [Salinivirga cyanobacteriivorans]